MNVREGGEELARGSGEPVFTDFGREPLTKSVRKLS
jgi:hypothetical protein